MHFLETAVAPEHAGYDVPFSADGIKWCVVQSGVLRKVMHTIKLKDLQEYAKPGGPLESMEALRMPCLSVSKVSLSE